MAGIALYKQKHLWIVEVDNVLQTFCKSISAGCTERGTCYTESRKATTNWLRSST